MTETKIAKENIERYLELLGKASDLDDRHFIHRQNCFTHKQTCQRWLGFCIRERQTAMKLTGSVIVWNEAVEEDLRQAIKLYEDAGI